MAAPATPDTAAPPQQAPAITEQIPSVQNGLSAIATANAPFIYFDEVPNFGTYNGIAHITLEAMRFMQINGAAVSDRAVVAHLRMNLRA
jgi:hypothetical protein